MTDHKLSRAIDRLGQLASSHALTWDDQIAARFTSYAGSLLQFNQAMNLIGPMDAERLVDELLIDSLVPMMATSFDGARVLDVGCGAGLPGLPLVMASQLEHITLVEPRQKRVTFMRIIVTRQGLAERVRIVHARHDEQPLGTFDRVISKAFEPPHQWLATAQPWLEPEGGQLLCMTRAIEREGLDARAAELGLVRSAQANMKGDDDRQVLVYINAPSLV